MISTKLTTINDSVEDMYAAIAERNIPVTPRKMNQIPRLVSLIKDISYPTPIPTDNLPTIADKCTAILQIKAQIKTVIENSGVQIGNSLITYGDCIRAIVSYNNFELSAPATYTGKNFNVIPYFNGQQVVATNWTITQGSQYATVNQYGRIDIAVGAVAQQITVSAQYNHYGFYTDSITIEVSYDNQLTIQCANVMTGTSGNCVAVYNSNVISPVWSITTGGAYATIDQSGNITILDSGIIVLQAAYAGYTATKEVNVVYQANTTTETTVDEEGNTTTTTTTTTTDPQTGATTTETSSTTVNDDGSTTSTESTTTENTDGSSTSTSTTTNTDGTSSESTTNTSAPDPETGSVTSNTNTTNYDEEGNTTGSSTNTTTENTDGSSTSSTTNYDAEGDPTTGTNQIIDSSGNNSTQDIEYDDQGDPSVTGYTIDTTDNPDGEKTFDGDGVNTEFYGFDTTRGFIMHIHFSIDFTKQPVNQDENHHNVLTMKRATPEPWYGFQIRQTGTTKNVILGTQFATGGNTNTTLPVGRQITSNNYEYDVEVTYDPTLVSNKFICRESINDVTVYTSNSLFPDIPELEYLTVCIGYALDSNGDPFRFSNIDVYEFSITKLNLVVPDPVIQFNGQRISLFCDSTTATIYYKLNHAATYLVYTGPINIYEDTYIETYAAISSIQSNVVEELCIYVPAHDYSQDYLTFRVTTGGVIMWKALGSGYTRTIEYSINDGSWVSITSTSAGVSIPVSVDDVVRFRGTNNTYAGSKANYSGFEGSTANFDIEGNIMSLIYGDNFVNQTTLSGTYNFCSIFKKATVVSAENLVLPTTTLTNYCYRAMFSLCPVLVTPPALPATSLAQGCYWYMFEGCGITTAPDLLATTLVRECYGYMFTQCTSLNYIKCLATSGFGTTQCLTGWVNRVAAAGIFIKDANATSWPSGNNGIPTGWTVVDAS